jgi:hypothetical protein
VLAVKRLLDVRREELLVVVAKLLAERLVFPGVSDVHAGSDGNASSG